MASTFSGIEIAKTSIIAHNRAINTAGHNIANANTPGYSRQAVSLRAKTMSGTAGLALPKTPGLTGYGVEVDSVKRLRDSFVDYQYRWENSDLGRYSVERENMEYIERILGEPSENGLRDSIVRFASALDELSKRPESFSVRSTIAEEAKAMTHLMNHTSMRMNELRDQLADEIETNIKAVNSYAEQIRQLNIRIMDFEAGGDNALDLRDKRDLLIDELSEFMRIDVLEQRSGAVSIRVGNRNIVEGNQADAIELKEMVPGDDNVELFWVGSDEQIELSSGILGGLINMRELRLVQYQEQLDNLATGIMTWFNDIHREGYGLDGTTGIDFFAGENALDMNVSEIVLENINLIAASSSSDVEEQGDGDNAARLAGIRTAPNPELGGSTAVDYFISLVSSLGVDSAAAMRLKDAQDFVVHQLEDRRQSVSGVSIDEEMADIIKYQHAYNAASRVMATLDEMLDTLINRTIR